MYRKSKIFFLCIFFVIQYVVLFSVLYALREIVFEQLINTLLTGVFLIVYLMTSYFTMTNYLFKKINHSPNIKEQIHSFREDGEHSAEKLAEIRRLIEENKHNEASKVINAMSQTIDDGEVLISNKEKTLSCLILDKYKVKCDSKGIKFNQKISVENLERYFTSKELTSILGNLLDNAIEAIIRKDSLINSSPTENISEKWISIEIKSAKSIKGQKGIKILVKNSGQTLEKDQADKIFTAGVSSKQGDNHGYGLAVVMDIVRKLGGTIQAVSHPETEIQVIVPES